MSTGIITETKIYGFTEFGDKVQIMSDKMENSYAKRVGGKIFHIVSGDNGATYKFYDASGNEMTDIAVGDEPYSYVVTGTPTFDKYYVYYGTALLSKTWGYTSTLMGTIDGIGAGKTNTAICMDGITAVDTTIWGTLYGLNQNEINGCDDWFVPSKAELETLRTATDSEGTAIGGIVSGNVLCSTEYSANIPWIWGSSFWSYYGTKSSSVSMVAARAF